MELKVVFANVTHGFIYAHHLGISASMVFSKFSVSDYVNYFSDLAPDILCLSETLIDDENRRSHMVDMISDGTGLNKSRQILLSGKSYLYSGKFYGLAILSRFEELYYEEYKIPNPKFEVLRPNGDYWIMDDKYIQYAKLKTDNGPINIFNLHYFPCHIFKRSIYDSEMIFSNQAVSSYILSKDLRIPTLIAGDFNNKDSQLAEIFPELFNNNMVSEVVKVETTTVDGKGQLDHLLITKNTIKVISAYAEKYLSDHYSLVGILKMYDEDKK